jgi:hypothetical protein
MLIVGQQLPNSSVADPEKPLKSFQLYASEESTLEANVIMTLYRRSNSRICMILGD